MKHLRNLNLVHLMAMLAVERSDAWRILSKSSKHTFTLKPPIIRRGGSLTSDTPNDEPTQPVQNSSDEDSRSEPEFTDGANSTAYDETSPTDDVVQEQLFVDDPSIDEDSSANVDRMEYADAYDEEEEEPPSVDFNAPGYEFSSEPSEAKSGESTATDGSAPAKRDDNHQGEEQTIELSSTITDEMKKIMMKDLNYKASDLEVIRPEIASIIVAKDVRRPMEGLPPNWYKDSLSVSPRASKRLFAKIAATLVIGGAALLAGSKIGEIDVTVLAESLKSSWTKPSLPSSTAVEEEDPFKNVFSVVEEAETRKEVPDEEEEPDHSVRPGEARSPDPVDELWLDKVITAVLSGMKRLFRM